jgi:hypothetical protein
MFGDSVKKDEDETSTEVDILGDTDDSQLGSGDALPKLSDPCGDCEKDEVVLTSDAVTRGLLVASMTVFETKGVALTSDVAEIVHSVDTETTEDGEARTVGVCRELSVIVTVSFEDTEATTETVSNADTSAVMDDEKHAQGVPLC